MYTVPLVIDVARVTTHAGNDEFRSEEHCVFFQLVIIDQPSRLIHFVRHRLEKYRRCRDFLRGREEAVRQVATIRQIEAHDATARSNDPGKDGKVSGRSGIGLDVDVPLGWIKTERSTMNSGQKL